MQELDVETTKNQELVDITAQVETAVKDMTSGVVCVFSPHTTAGILINEHADPDVATDMLLALDHVVTQELPYRHAEGNSTAHVKATMVGTSQLVGVRDGRLVLGTWQGIFLAEFDGPRNRRVWLRLRADRE